MNLAQNESETSWWASFPQSNSYPVLEVDMNGAITYCNPATLTVLADLGCPGNVRAFVPPDFPDILKSLVQGEIHGAVREVQLNGTVWSEYIYLMTPVYPTARIYATDVTARAQTEAALRQSQSLLNAVGQIARIGGWELDATTLALSWTKQTYAIHEVPPNYKPLLDEVFDFFHPDDRPRLAAALRRALDEGEPYDMEVRFITARGNHLWARTICQPQVVAGRTVRLVGIFQDVTERKQAEESLRQFTARLQIQHEIDAAILAAQSPEDIAVAALTHLRSLIPCRFAGVCEIDLARLRRRDLLLLDGDQVAAHASEWYPLSPSCDCCHAMDGDEVHLTLDMAVSDIPSLAEQDLLARGLRSSIVAPLRVQETLIGAIRLADAAPDFFQPAHLEILNEVATSLAVALQHARLREQAQADVAAKAMLLREVNHRVLNNLMMIQSLLEIERQRPETSGTDFRAVLEDVSHRVGGLLTVHRLLSSVQWKPLDLGVMISEVIHAALSGAPFRHAIQVEVTAPATPLRVVARQAIAIALICNELTTNSIKYAFRERSGGRIQVRLAADTADDDAQVRMIFCDDGPGWPDDVLMGNRRDVGLWLVEANVKYTLSGNLTLRHDGGAVVEIVFKLQAAGKECNATEG